MVLLRIMEKGSQGMTMPPDGSSWKEGASAAILTASRRTLNEVFDSGLLEGRHLELGASQEAFGRFFVQGSCLLGEDQDLTAGKGVG